MRTHHATRLAGLVLTALATASCLGSDAADGAPTASDTASGELPVDDVVALIDGGAEDLAATYVITNEDVEGGDTFDPFDIRVGTLAFIANRLPDPTATADSPTVTTRYEQLVSAVETWRAAATAVRDEAKQREDELQPLIDAWVAQDAGAPGPAVYVDLLRADEDEATAYGDACAAFADEVGVTLDCYLLPAAEPVATSYDLSIGDVGLTMDVENVENDSRVDGGVCVASEMGTIMVIPPPAVTDPAAPLHRDPSTAIPSTVPWPDDLETWYSQLPVEVVEAGEEVLSDGGITWSYVVLAGTDEGGGPFLAIDGGRCFWLLGDIFELVLWETTIDGQPVVAVSDGRPDRDYEDHLEEARQVLDTIRVDTD